MMETEKNELHGNWLRRYGFVVALYVLATLLTDAYFMGDSGDYADSIIAGLHGVDYKFWEFGHLLWRPLGWLTYRAFGSLTPSLIGTADPYANVLFTLTALVWVSGLVCTLLLRAFVECLCGREWVANVAALAFVLSNGFLNYAQTGCSYVPGLMFLLLSLYIIARDGNDPDRHLRTALLAGSALAAALLFWVLYFWAVPGVLLAPLFLFGYDRPRRRLVVEIAAISGAITALAFAAVLVHLGIFTVAEIRAWIFPAGAPEIKGFSRAVFGFARSFVNMGDDGRLLKRYLLGDPFSPVSLMDVVRLSLWKFLLFYLFLAAVVVNLARSAGGRRVLGLLLAGALPVLSFAVVFLGGDLERYMPLYPLLFLALAYSLLGGRMLRGPKIVVLLFVGVLVVSNLSATAKFVLDGRREITSARVKDVAPLLKPGSKLITVNHHDDLVSFNRDFPFDPLNRNPNLRLWSVITPGSPWVPKWRQDFASQVLSAWEEGGDVWISRRAFSPRPHPRWNWVEGDDKRVTWAEVHEFLIPLETGREVGGEDGFVLVEPSLRNMEYLANFPTTK